MRALLLALLLAIAAPAYAKVETLASPKGVNFWVAKDQTQPIFTLRMVFTNTGFAYDPDNRSGLASLTASMLSEGAGDMDALAFKQALQAKAVKLSIATDADHFFITVTSLSEHQAEALRLLASVISAPRFDEDALARVKRETLSALIRAEEDPDYIANRAWSEHYFGAHPYAKPRIGTKAGIEGISADDLKAYAKRSFTAGNLIVSGAGDVDTEKLGEALDTLAAALPSSFTPAAELGDVTPQASAPVAIEKDIPQTVIQFGGLGLTRSDPRYIAGYVLNEIIGGGTLKSRLGTELREKSGLTYHIGTELAPLQRTGLLWGAFATRRDKRDEALTMLKSTLDAIAKNGVTDKELSDAKAYLTGSFPLSLDTNAELSGFMTGMQLYKLGSDYLEKRNALINAVTKDEVNALAKNLLTFDTWQVVQVGKP